MRRILFGTACLMGLSGCGGDPPVASISAGAGPESAASAPDGGASRPQLEIATNRGRLVVELHSDKAPATVENFLRYADEGLYDNSLVHYVDDTMVLAGGFTAEGQPAPVFPPVVNESDNGLSNRRGTMAMSRGDQDPDSATSQFFFNLQDNAGFDHQEGQGEGGNGYCVFGEVVEGLDVLDAIAASPVEDADGFAHLPVERVTIQHVKRLD